MAYPAPSVCEPPDDPVFTDLPTVPFPVLSPAGIDHFRVAPYVPEVREAPRMPFGRHKGPAGINIATIPVAGRTERCRGRASAIGDV